jgi:tetratricopeptide (TPR) repeat protein/tRNA A-37 threonylcarbamoyl transferase component Bud32
MISRTALGTILLTISAAASACPPGQHVTMEAMPGMAEECAPDAPAPGTTDRPGADADQSDASQLRQPPVEAPTQADLAEVAGLKLVKRIGIAGGIPSQVFQSQGFTAAVNTGLNGGTERGGSWRGGGWRGGPGGGHPEGWTPWDDLPDLLKPDAPCGRGPAFCYSTDKLRQIAAGIGTLPDYQDIAPLARTVLTADRAGSGPVSLKDVLGVLKYMDAEQDAATEIGAKVPNWTSVKDDPKMLAAALSGLKPEDRSAILMRLDGLRNRMNDTLIRAGRDGGANPFHGAVMSNDKFADTVMKGLNAPPSMPGGWGPVDQGNPAAHNYDSQQALQNGNPQAAAASAQKALEIDPQNSEALSNLAAAKYDLKDMSGAAEAANKALELDPNNAQAQTVAALAHGLVAGGAKVPTSSAQQHNFADVPAGLSGASAPWRQLSVSDEKQRAAVNAARDAERALNRGDLSAAKAAADRALAADPHASYAYGLKAFAEMKGGDAAGALRDAVAGLALNPADKMAQKARAQALLKLGRYPEGLLAANAAVAGDPRSAFARYLQAEARAASGDLAGAREALKAAAALDARYAEMYKASLQVADNGDMAFLFPDLKPGALAAAHAAAAAPAGSSRNARFLKIAGGAAAGGGLLAWLLWQLFGASLAPALKTVFTRRGPRVADPSTAVEAPSLEPPQAKDPSLLRGQYKTLKQIGVGGMGMVYEGSDVSLGRRVAIKKMRDELRLDRRQRERFVSEAKTVAALHHPNVVDIYAIVDDSDDLSLIFEYVSGKTLHEIVHGRGPLPFDEARRLYRGVCDALDYAHARGVIHRDLKPSNIMITDEGRPKVMDFGIARAAKDAMTRYSMTNTVVGTPPYMAPEQEQGVVRKESDVFALAVCLYETLTGTLPFSGTGGGMVMNKINKAFVPASRVVAGLPEGLDEVFDKAFEPDPDKRYRTVAELRAALEALAPSAAARA